MPDNTPAKPVPGVGKRQARIRRAEGSATPSALSDRERFEKARADHKELAAENERLALAQARREVVSVADIAAQVRAIGEEIKAALLTRDEELAVTNAGLSAEQQLKNNAASTRAILSRWREFAQKNGAKEI